MIEIAINMFPDKPVTGYDSLILRPPNWMKVDDETLRTNVFRHYLRQISLISAAHMQQTLHHAVWVLTTDPQQVRTRGLMHDCPSCQAGVDQALAGLRDEPEQGLLVGNLYWAD